LPPLIIHAQLFEDVSALYPVLALERLTHLAPHVHVFVGDSVVDESTNTRAERVEWAEDAFEHGRLDFACGVVVASLGVVSWRDESFVSGEVVKGERSAGLLLGLRELLQE